MRQHWLRDEPGDAALQESISAPPQELLRRLALQVTNVPTFPVCRSLDGEKPEVLLEVEVAGARYLLLRSQPASPPIHALLSRREEEIARLIAQGYPNKTIAAALDLSPWTVCTYIRRIFAKIGVSSRAAMVARLLATGSIKEHQRR